MNKFNVMLMMVIVALTVALTGCGPNQWATKEVLDGTSMKQGEHITVQQRDGQTVEGFFAGTVTMPLEEYREYYSTTSQSNGTQSILPKLGEPIFFSTSLSNEKVWKGELVGFNEQSVLIKLDGESEANEIYVPSLVAMANTSGKNVERMKFRSLFVNGSIPLMTSFVVKSSSGDVQVPISSIKSVEVTQGEGSAGITMSAQQYLTSRSTTR